MPNFLWKDGRAATQALYHFDNSYADSSLFGRTLSHFGTDLEHTYSKFGTYAVLVGNSTCYLYASGYATNIYGQWTVDFWIRPDDQSPYNEYYTLFVDLSSENGQGTVLYLDTINNVLFLEHRTSVSTYHTSIVGSIVNVWAHIAIVKTSSTNINLHLNGVLSSSLTISGAPAASHYYGLGNVYGFHGVYQTTGGMPGCYDEFRMSSTTRWTSNFTPPTAAYVY